METNEDFDNALLKMQQHLSVFEKQKLRDQLVFYVRHLLLHDQGRLFQLLYRVDVSEEALKGYLRENPNEDAAELISDMLITRQAEKQKSKENSGDIADIPEDEKW